MHPFFANLNLDKNTPIPLYFQLRELLLEFIKSNAESVNLPTEQQLCAHFDISRSTVRQALRELVNEGFIERHKAKGSVSTPKKLEHNFLSILESFNDEMQEKGLVPATEVLDLSLVEPPESVRSALNLKEGEQAVQLIRLRGTNGTPIVLVHTFLPAHYKNIGNLINEDLTNNSLYKLLQKNYAVDIGWTRRSIEIRSAGEFEAQYLQVLPKSPLQYIETISRTEDGTPFEYSRAYYRGDRNAFVIEIRNKRL
ncbi:MAG: GntR family transcriptional regulator [Erysipelotrichaceae bacterium]|nr:GntR family transcriptional regulator [Erysipelotrichaceae bacterium]MDD3523068.1 GntR family transcriptional regulator [Candidatus Cloacimonadota bacterium]